ncbi:MAG TPA: N,N-dimethylformamidase beta subunit family domain-containing protein, partial [Vicinamibacterales bacterium]|nr:N,N-dimethylformamidase beta subunit family domain-containing protein [Vicinamibacterales bacterium]
IWLVVPLCLLLHVVSVTPAAAQQRNLIQLENAKPGTTDWKLTKPGFTSGVIEGYASLTSVNRGGRILLFVSTAEPSYTIDLFRLGYYGGLGGRRMRDTIQRSGVLQPVPTPDPTTGLIECQWTNPFALDIPNTSDPTDWMSGVYVAKLTASVSGTQAYIIFAVRDDARRSDLLMAQSVSTYQAYNPWGGKSLYGTIAQRTDDVNKAVQVSFNRPYFGEGTSGAGGYLEFEYWWAWWLEANGYDVSYATSIDVDADPTLLLSHRAYLSVGHDEYWSWRMRDNVEAARDAGVSLGFFSGNTSYWQVRFTPSPVTGDPSRTMVSYKNMWSQDPITPAWLKTNEWRYAPVNRPEDAMIGVRYITQARPPLVIDDASHWVFTGTGLHNGDVLTNPDGSAFLGYEVDAMGPASPPQTQRLAHSPADPTRANFADMTVYRATSGATVFAIGSIYWSLSLPATQQITRNVLARFISGAFADTTPVRPPLPSPWTTADIGDVGRPGYVGAVTPQGFTLNGAGHGIYSTTDALYYAYQPLSGDGTIIARLTALQLYWDNRAGVMIRESLDPGSRYVAIHGRPTGSRGVLNEGVDLVTRPQPGAGPSFAGSIDVPMPYWLKLTRTGDVFDAAVSSDGTTWTSVGRVTVPMQRTVFIGTHVLSAQPSVWMTASFDNITVTNVGLVTPQWRVVGMADFNRGGHADVLWFNPNTGTLAEWLLDGQGNVIAAPNLSLTCGSGCSPPWQVVGVGDFNGDGHADVLWFNASTGQLSEWLLDGQGNVI